MAPQWGAFSELVEFEVMQAQKLKVELRTRTGKSAARKLRRSGKIPAILYGPGMETVYLALDPRELFHRLDPERKRNTVFELEIAGSDLNGPVYAMVKEFHQDTLKDELVHLDFYRVEEGRPVEITVPIVFTGKSKGEQLGGRPHAVLREVPIRCVPEKVPARIEYDVTEVNIGEIVHVKDVDPGEGIEILLPPEQTLYTISAGRGETAEAQEAAEGGEAAEGEGEAQASSAE